MMEEHRPMASASDSADPTPAVFEPPESLADPRALQILTTEHWSLLSARSLVYNEAFARAGMFLTFLSASLVALALAAQAMSFDRAFLLLAATLLTFDLVIGLATHGRVLDATIDDLRSIHGMNRIRNAYVQIAPGVLPFLTTSVHDDVAGVRAAYGAPTSPSVVTAFLHGLTTTGGMIATIVALVGSTLAGLTAVLVGSGPGTAFGIGVVAFGAGFGLLARHSYRAISGFEAALPTRFPSPPSS